MPMRVRCTPILAALALLLVTSGSSWAATIVIDDFDDSDYSDDGLLFDTRTVAPGTGTSYSIAGGALNVLFFTSTPGTGGVTLTYSSVGGINMTETGGFELEGNFLPTSQTVNWTWTARDNGTDLASNSGTWTVGNQPLLMGPDAAGVFTGWKTLEFSFDWALSDAGAVSISASRLVAIPEPSSLVLCGFALGMVGYGYRRVRRSKQRG